MFSLEHSFMVKSIEWVGRVAHVIKVSPESQLDLDLDLGLGLDNFVDHTIFSIYIHISMYISLSLWILMHPPIPTCITIDKRDVTFNI